jgi:hypothetical protein
VALATILLPERVVFGHRKLFPLIVAGEALPVGGSREVRRCLGEKPLATRHGENDEKPDDHDHHEKEMDIPGLHLSPLREALAQEIRKNRL